MAKKDITVIGLGPGELDQLPLGIYRKLKSTKGPIYTRTLEHPIITELVKEGIEFIAFDQVYQSFDDFEAVYQSIVNKLLKLSEEQSVLYTVPGHPMLAERTVKLLVDKEKEEADLTVSIEGGQSFLDALFTSLKIDPIEGFQFLDGTSFSRERLMYKDHIIFCQVYDEVIASEIKLTLMEDLPHDFPIYIVEAVGTSGEKISKVPLYELDRSVSLSNLTSVYLPPVPDKYLNHQFGRLREVIAKLRGPNGCPWDKKQTHSTLRSYLIEEAYELIEAIEGEDDEGIIEELGDILLQVMLHSQIGEDEGFFTIDDVILTITEKMIRRHPHVFGDVKVENVEEVVTNWDEIKREEKGEKRQSILDGIASSLPGLLFAQQLQKKAAKVGFDWENPEPMWEKVEEEIREFKLAIKSETFNEQELEFGDILFALINVARYYKINPELAVQRTNKKFFDRFKYMEEKIKQANLEMNSLKLVELDQYWEEAKRNNKLK